jgi:hypothetical protein
MSLCYQIGIRLQKRIFLTGLLIKNYEMKLSNI